jgi:hypothetical protein
MLHNNISSMITSQVEAMLPRFSKNLGLAMSLDCRIHAYDKKAEDLHQECAMVYFVFMRQQNYTKVFTQVLGFTDPLVSNAWKLEADHDSCWRDGVSRTLWDTMRSLEDAIEKVGFEDRKEWNKSIKPSLFKRTHYAEVEFEQLTEKRYGGTFNLTLTNVPIQEIHKFLPEKG